MAALRTAAAPSVGTRPPKVLLAGSLVTGVLVAIPLVYLVVRTSEAGWADVEPLLLRGRTLELAVNSLALAASVAAGCLLIGVPTAWLITRADLPWAPVWRVLAALPLAVPSYVAAYAWVATWPGLHGFVGSVLVLTLVSSPYVTIPVAAALRRADRDVEDVARTLGRSPWGAARSTVWPQIAPAAGAGALLAALYALSDFGAVAVMRFEAFTYGIQLAYRVGFDRTLAAVMALVLTVLALLVVLAERWFRGNAERRQPPAGTGAPASTRPLGRGTVPALTGLAAVAVLALGVPIVSLFVRLAEGTARGLEWGELYAAAVATLTVSSIGAVIAIMMALPVGLLAARYRGRGVAALESASYLGNALPGIVVGLSLVFFTVNVVPGLYQTSLALAFAYAVMFLPKAVGSVRASMAQVPPGLEDAARTLGRSPAQVWGAVTARIALPGVTAGALLVALTAMKELPATLLLRPTGMDTLATEMWSRTTVNAYGSAAPYAVTLMLVASVPAYLLSRPERRA
ncbi:MAG: iron ABC transporter permease [Nocardioidaceae bacterium]|nr:iron ABC transporter permease [Nocardioidaceae bacterium]